MKNGISVWNFIDEENEIIDLSSYFLKNGFDYLSFTPKSIFDLTDQKLNQLISLLDNYNSVVTIHADSNIDIEEIDNLFKIFSDKIKCLSLDPNCRIDPDASFFPSLNIIPTLEYLVEKTEKYNTLFGLEDFPLDSNALGKYREELTSVLSCPRYGILLDLGHMNLRTNDFDYFIKKGISNYISEIPVPIIELHVHDNDLLGDKHMPPGMGKLDYSLVSTELKTIGFDGHSTIEIAPLRYNSKPKKELTSALKGLDHWKRSQ